MLVSYSTRGFPRSVQFEVSGQQLEQLTGGEWKDTFVNDLAIFDPLFERCPREFRPYSETYIAEQFREWLQRTGFVPELIILRGSGMEFEEAILGDEMLQMEIENKGFSVALLSSWHDTSGFHMTYKHNPMGGAFDFTPFMTVLRHAEFVGLLRLHGSILSAGESSHFHLPSGAHANTFIRMADTLRASTAVQRIAEWLMPYVTRETSVFADSPSLTPLLIQLQLMAREVFSKDLIVDNFQGYPASLSEMSNALTNFRTRSYGLSQLQRGMFESKSLFLISVNGSGKLIQSLSRVNALENDEKVIVLCDTVTEKTTAEQGLYETMSIFPIVQHPADHSGKCLECGTKHPVKIHPASFERLSIPSFRTLRMSPALVEDMRAFWESVDRADAVKLHHSSPNTHGVRQTYRHFGIYIDVPRLLQEEKFRLQCTEELRHDHNWGHDVARSPAVVLIPDNDTFDEMRDLVIGAFWPSDTEVGLQRVLKTVSIDTVVQALSEFETEDWVLIADDAIVTGTRFRIWKEQIQQIANNLGKIIRVAGFVAVARPDSMENFQPVINRFRDDNLAGHLRWGKLVLLPSVGADSCPWCVELKLLELLGDQLKGSARDYYNSRVSLLRDPPISEHFLLGSEQVSLNRLVGAIWGDLAPRTSFAAASSATWTQCSKLATVWSGPEIEIFDAMRFMKSYMEPQLRVGMLRTVSPLQTRSPEQDKFVATEFANWLDGQNRGYDGATWELAEIGWAAVRNAIPPSPFLAMIGTKRSKNAALEMVCQLIELNGIGLEANSSFPSSESDDTRGIFRMGGRFSRRDFWKLWRQESSFGGVGYSERYD